MDSIFLSRDVDFTKKFENGNPSIYRKRNVEKLHISSLLTSKDVGNINLIKKKSCPRCRQISPFSRLRILDVVLDMGPQEW